MIWFLGPVDFVTLLSTLVIWKLVNSERSDKSAHWHDLRRASAACSRKLEVRIWETTKKRKFPNFQSELRHDKTNKVTVPSEDSDQPGHLPSPIRVFAGRSMGS